MGIDAVRLSGTLFDSIGIDPSFPKIYKGFTLFYSPFRYAGGSSLFFGQNNYRNGQNTKNQQGRGLRQPDAPLS